MTKVLSSSKACLNCINKPCVNGCPLNNNIPEFIKNIKLKKYKKAFDVLSNTTVLSPICGRICPKEYQCEGKCVKKFKSFPVQIGELESFIGTLALKNNWKIRFPKKTKHHVLVIGGGPAGLTCAAFLRRNGIKVTIIEKHNYLGGLLVHGIPKFRLSKKIVQDTINMITRDIKVIYNQELGHNFKLSDVIDKYDAIFIGIGANISNKMNIKGEYLNGVYGGNELLEYKTKINFKDKVVVIVGGGNTAIDISRTIKRLGAKQVIIVYRKDEKFMPADKSEIENAKNDGIEFVFQTNILNIQGNKKVEKIEVIKTKLIKKNNKIDIINLKDTNYFINCDYVIMAIGSHSDRKVTKDLNLKLDRKRKIKINNTHTSNEKIFAGGDITNTKSTVASASRSGRDASIEIIKYLKES